MPGLGEDLRNRRLAAALTQEELAERALMSVRTISDLERGVNKTARKHTAVLLADALHLEGDDRDAFVALALGRRAPAGAPGPAAGGTGGWAPVPGPRSPTIGRSADVGAVVERLHAGARIVTLLGPGGVGKTRLAQEVALRVDPSTEVGFVPLSAVAAPADVLPAIAAAGGMPVTGLRPVADELVDHLRDRAVVLVLDNVEQVVAVAPELGDLVDRLPGLSLVVTSRVRLRLPAEQVHEVAPLDTEPAVELLVDRARAAGAEVDAGATTVLADIARRLDSLPLAIELAAARLRLLPPAALLARLDRRHLVLTADGSGGPDRHRTLEAALAWSLDLLEPVDREVFEDLSVFVGSFSLDAAAVVTGRDEDALFVALERLVDASLVRSGAGPDGEPRLSMLATMREGGAARLVVAGRDRELRDRHLARFVRIADAAATGLVGPDQTSWLAQLDADAGDLRRAVDHAVASGAAGPAVRLGAGLWRWWYLRGLLEEGRRRLDEVLAVDPGDLDGVDGRAAAIAAYGAGNLAYLQGDVAGAIALQERARAAHRRLGPHAGEAHVLGTLGMIAQYGGDDDLALERFTDALAIARSLDDDRAVAVALTNLASLAKQQARFTDALEHLDEAGGRFEVLGDLRSVADLLTTRADVAAARGHYGEAEAVARDALARFIDLQDRVGENEARQILAEVLERAGDARAAADAHRAVLDLSRALGDEWGEARALAGLAAAAGRDGEDPRPLYEASIAAHRRLDHPRGLGLALLGLARATEPGEAVGLLKEARSILAAAGDPDWITCIEELAELAVVNGQPDRAARLLGAAAARRESLGFPVASAAVATHKTRADAVAAALGSAEARRLAAEGGVLRDEDLARLADAVHG